MEKTISTLIAEHMRLIDTLLMFKDGTSGQAQVREEIRSNLSKLLTRNAPDTASHQMEKESKEATKAEALASAPIPDALTALECRDRPPSIERMVAAKKAHVLHLMEIRQVPLGVTSTAKLHEYCDANCLGGLCDEEVFGLLVAHFGGVDEAEGMPQGLVNLLNSATRELDRWLEAGALPF